jgi:NAD(P)-dependent dehydrogenase (short-subunit alcohol dehydrogenase family)
MNMDWKKEVALVTGASRGLGRALAQELATRGAKVALVARGRDELDRSVREIREAGGTAFSIVADVGDIRSVYPILAQANALAGTPTLLINNASTLGPTPLTALLETECEDLAHVFGVNLLGPFRLTKAVLGPMILRGRGTILNLSSDAAVSAYPTWGAYASSKAALDHLTRIWAEELRDSSIRFLSVDPGEMDTQMHSDAIPDADRSLLREPSDVARKIIDHLEVERFVNGERVIL